MKKILLTSLFICLLAPMNANAEKKPFGDGLYWELNDVTLTISGKGAMPDHCDYLWNNKRVERIIVEIGVTSIAASAFWECNNLKSVVIPCSVTSIGKNAFSNCKNLASITIPNSVTTIGAWAFFHCENLVSVTLPEFLTSIEEGTFGGCYNLTHINFPSGLSSIGEVAFQRCDKLKEISIPKSVRSIGENAFRNMRDKYYEGKITNMPSTLINEGEMKWRFWGLSEKSVNDYLEMSSRPLKKIKEKGGYTSVAEINDGDKLYYVVEKNNHYGLTNAEGKVIVPTEMEALESAGTGYLRYKLNGFWGVMNYAGKILIDTDRGYTSIGDYVSFTKRFPYTIDWLER